MTLHRPSKTTRERFSEANISEAISQIPRYMNFRRYAGLLCAEGCFESQKSDRSKVAGNFSRRESLRENAKRFSYEDGTDKTKSEFDGRTKSQEMNILVRKLVTLNLI